MNKFKRIHFSFLGILFLGASIFGACWAVTWLVRGNYLVFLITLGASLCCFDIGFQMAYAISGAARPRTTYGPGGTTIRPQQCVDLVFYIGTVAGVFAAASYLALNALGVDSDISWWIIQRTAPLISIFVLIFGGWGLYGMFRHRGESRLRLSPNSFDVWNGHWCVSMHGTWEEVEQISDHLPRSRRIRREMIVLALPKGRNAMLITDTITTNSDALREWVRFYWQHPDHRNELTDRRAIQRLDDEKFTVE